MKCVAFTLIHIRPHTAICSNAIITNVQVLKANLVRKYVQSTTSCLLHCSKIIVSIQMNKQAKRSNYSQTFFH